jgi:hypothetical protein
MALEYVANSTVVRFLEDTRCPRSQPRGRPLWCASFSLEDQCDRPTHKSRPLLSGSCDARRLRRGSLQR